MHLLVGDDRRRCPRHGALARVVTPWLGSRVIDRVGALTGALRLDAHPASRSGDEPNLLVRGPGHGCGSLAAWAGMQMVRAPGWISAKRVVDSPTTSPSSW